MLPSPKLDRRSAAQVRAEARALAAHYLGATWQGVDSPNDPASQLLDLFSRMMEMLIVRLNGVPEKNFLAFLDMVGVERSPGAPASVPVTFLPSAKAPEGGLVPARTKVATTQTDRTDAHVFETRQPIYATAAKLESCVSVLPGAGRFSRVALAPVPPKVVDLSAPATAILSAPGLAALPHVLYLGGERIFGRKEKGDITLSFGVAVSPAVFEPAHLRWKKFDNDQKKWVDIPESSVTYVVSLTSLEFSATLSGFDNSAKSTVAGQEDFWVAWHHDGGFPVTPALQSISSIRARFDASSTRVPIEKAFANGVPLDLSKPFKPFGERPRFGDAFYLTSSRAFSPVAKQITVAVEIKPYSAAELKNATSVTTIVTWQYLTADGTWRPLTKHPVPPGQPPPTASRMTFEHSMTASGNPITITHMVKRDGVASPAEDGSFFGQAAGFSFERPSDMGRGKVNGEEGFWLRALLESDDPYGKEASVAPAQVTNPPGNPFVVTPSSLVPPVVKTAELSFTNGDALEDVPRVVSDNNLTRIDHQSPDNAPAYPLTPFVSPVDKLLPSGAGAAFGSGDALYLGFDRAFGDVYISLYVKLRETFPSATTPVEQGNPQLSWEYLAPSSGWRPLDVQDETSQLTTSGTVSFVGPSDAGPAVLFEAVPPLPEQSLFWLRARLSSGRYDYPPALQGIYPNTVLADNRYSFQPEVIVGSGSGERNQRCLLLKTPVLGGELWVREPETPPQAEVDELRIELAGGSPAARASSPVDSDTAGLDRGRFVHWRRVPNFLASGPRSRHYTLDPVSGELRLGDGRQGMLAPIARDNLVFRDYRVGGGEDAMRAAAPLAVKELKSSLPYIEKVFNVEAASGGANFWSEADILKFGPQLIKNKGRAVSAEDFEWMVLERFSEIARVKCLSTRAPGAGRLVFQPGAVTIVVVPKGSERAPQPTSALLRRVRDFLTEQCLGSIVSDLHVLGPAFAEVTVKARVRAVDPRENSEVERRALRALEDFFHPLRGGEAGSGWEFGRDVQLSEVYAVLQRIVGVDYVLSADFVGHAGVSELAIDDESATLVASGLHEIEMT